MSTISLAPPAARPVEVPRVSLSAARVEWKVAIALLTYAVLVIAAVRHHEPWADEAQAWLLGRDASMKDLWGSLLHYEGSPGLWQTILHVLIRLGLPYYAYGYLGALFGFAAAWLVVRYAPFPLAFRLILPFTFFLAYQYVVIARSYDLIPVLLFGCAILYKDEARRIWLFTLLLCLLAAVSVHGLILSACIWLSLFVFSSRKRELALPLLAYGVCAGLLSVAAYPAGDVTFVTHPKYAFDNWLTFCQYTLTETYTGEGYSTAAVIALSIPFLWRGRALLMFAVSTLILCTFGSVVYAHVWHQGLLFLAWLFAIWIAASRVKPSKAALAALAVVMACHCYWTAMSISYDWKNVYSAGKVTARYLRGLKIAPGHLYGVGYASTAVKPYFPARTFAGGPAYWDWSTRNRTNDAPSLQLSGHREYVVVGYKSLFEQDRWSRLLSALRYSRIQHFDGNLFWHTAMLEPESFDVYRQPAGAPDPVAASEIPMGDEKVAYQLLSGFYGREAGWRWTKKDFSVALKPPAGAGRTGAWLRLSIYIPDQQIRSLGPITLRANLDGQDLAPRTFSKGGAYVYSAQLTGSQLNFDAVCADFHLDKAVAQAGRDARELGVIVTSVALEPK